jgi:membrane protease YdiL (CAAX protease family)
MLDTLRWRWSEVGGKLLAAMDVVTVTSMSASYGFAVVLFLAAALVKYSLAQNRSLPPPLPLGKVSDWTYRKLDLLLVGIIVGFYFLMVIANALFADKLKEHVVSASDLILNIGIQFFFAGMVFVVMVSRIRPAAWLGLKWRQWPLVVVIAPVTVLTMWACFAGLYALGYEGLMENLGVEIVQDSVNLFQTHEDPSVLILMSITAVIVAPLCEEVVFRGYIYPVLKKYNGMWAAAFVSALIFSAAHGSLAALLPLFIFGVVLVILYESTGSIWAPIGAHFLFNAATVAVQLLTRYGYIPEQMPQ